jgi:hypothetical protein
MGDGRRGHPLVAFLIVVVTLAGAFFVWLVGAVVACPSCSDYDYLEPDWLLLSWFLVAALFILMGGLWVARRVRAGHWGFRRKGSA